MDTIFQKIARRELPAFIIAENERAIAFLDKSPLVDGHILVAPKQAFETITEIPQKDLASVMELVQQISSLLKLKLHATGINLLHASGKSAQQSVPHFHIHVIPRFDDDGHDFWPQGSFAKQTTQRTAQLLK